METKWWAILLILLTTALTSVAQVFLKIGSPRLPEIFTNLPLLIGASLYVAGAAMMIIAFKGGEVTVLYPIFATSYVWVSLLSARVFGELISTFKWLGIFTIMMGISFIAFGSKQMPKKDERSVIEIVEAP